MYCNCNFIVIVCIKCLCVWYQQESRQKQPRWTLYLDQRRQNHLSFGHSSLCAVKPHRTGRIEQINKTCPHTGTYSMTWWKSNKQEWEREKVRERRRGTINATYKRHRGLFINLYYCSKWLKNKTIHNYLYRFNGWMHYTQGPIKHTSMLYRRKNLMVNVKYNAHTVKMLF